MPGRRDRTLAAAIPLIGFAATLAAGAVFAPSPRRRDVRRWYEGLRKPGFAPGGPVVAGVWLAIDAALAYGAYRLLRRPRSPGRDAALQWWALNVASVAGWSWLFFERRALAASAVASGGMVLAGVGYARAAAPVDRGAAWMAAPLVSWLTFATVVAEEVWRRNPEQNAEGRRRLAQKLAPTRTP